MAIGFNTTKGSAQKNSIVTYNYASGEDHHVRLVGDLLPRYVYWVKGKNNKNIPMECLSFDRNSEAFTNVEPDHVKDFYPDLKCGWSYAVQCIDYSDKSIKVLNLKRKLFDQILVAMEELGDPTDYTTGYDIYFKRKKTGPQVFNVEYQLAVLKCKPRELEEWEQALVKDHKSMDEVLVRPTADAQLALLREIQNEGSSEVSEDISSEFDVS
jgi:hypothetical protein